MTAPCSPWVQTSRLCSPDDFEEGDLERAVEVASWLLYNATGRRWPGVCTDEGRPCTSRGVGQMFQNPVGSGSRPLPIDQWGRWDWWGGATACSCSSDPLDCGCRHHPNVKLPGNPIVTVDEVLIDGEPFHDWRILDDRWLIRTDGGHWPCCQDLALPPDEPGTWQITYLYGSAPPPAGVLAAEALACELAKAWQDPDDDECRLPRRLTQLIREGVTMQILDPFEFLNENRFGIYEVDAFLSVANAGRAPGVGAGRVLTGADYRSTFRRVR